DPRPAARPGAHHRGAERGLPGAEPVRGHEAPGVLEGAGAGVVGRGGRGGRVVVRRWGGECWSRLTGVPLRAVYERWMGQYADRWAESLLRLKETAERRGRAGMSRALDGGDGKWVGR